MIAGPVGGKDHQIIWPFWPAIAHHGPLVPPTPLLQAHFGSRGCETGFGRGFSQLTFSTERGEYLPSGFPTQTRAFCPPGIVLGMNETCEEKL